MLGFFLNVTNKFLIKKMLCIYPEVIINESTSLDLRLTLSINILTQNVSCACDRCSQLSHFHPHPLLWNMLVNMS